MTENTTGEGEETPLPNILSWDDEQFDVGILSVRYGLGKEILSHGGVLGESIDTQLHAEEVDENEYRATLNLYAWALFPEGSPGIKSFARFLINDDNVYEFQGAGVTFDLGNARLVRDGELVMEVGDELLVTPEWKSVPAVRGAEPTTQYLQDMQKIDLATEETLSQNWENCLALMTISRIAPITSDAIVERRFDSEFGLKELRPRED